MSDNMSLSVNGQSQVPPGFRFHPTEEELLRYYLRKKVAYEKIDLDVIRDVDLNKLEPWDIQETCKIGTMPQNDWYFFSHKDKKYPTGTRTNRATAAGFWKATGRDKVIHSNCKRIGMRKTLVFYKGRAPHGQKSDWIMHEYRLDDNPLETSASNIGESSQEDGWVVCRVFKKKNYHKALEGTQLPSTTLMDTRILMNNNNNNSTNDGILDQILAYMGRSCKQEHNINRNDPMQFLNHPTMNNNDQDTKFIHLPGLENPTVPSLGSPNFSPDCCLEDNNQDGGDCNYPIKSSATGLSDWAALDRLVASQLNGQVETTKNLPYYGDHVDVDDDDEMLISFPLDHHDTQLTTTSPCSNKQQNHHQNPEGCNSEVDIWSFARSSSSSSDPLGHLSI